MCRIASFILCFMRGTQRRRTRHQPFISYRPFGPAILDETQASSAMPGANLSSLNIELLVLDMAGTTVDEDGLVYRQLHQAMVETGGLSHLTMHDLHPWHGAQKVEVMRHFVHRDWDRIDGRSPSASEEEKEALVQEINHAFEAGIHEGYFGANSTVKLISPKLPAFLRSVRAAGIKVALNTGYPIGIQRGLVERLGMADMVDEFISAQEVPRGRLVSFLLTL